MLHNPENWILLLRIRFLNKQTTLKFRNILLTKLIDKSTNKSHELYVTNICCGFELEVPFAGMVRFASGPT
jgi:hypothetical protein